MLERVSLSEIQARSYERATKVVLASYPKARAMNESELDEFLGEKHYAVLATSTPDGRAHATPVGFVVWKKAFWMASVEGTRFAT